MDNYLVGTLLLAIIFILFIYNKGNDYLIKDNSFDLLLSIKAHSLEGEGNISIVSSRYVDNARIISFMYEGEFGMAVYLKGYNGKLKCQWVQYGVSRCFSRTIFTDKGKYLIAAGDNKDSFISSIGLNLKKENIKISTRGERYFLKVWPLLDEEAIEGIAFMRLYNSRGEDITEELMYPEADALRDTVDFAFIN